VIDARRRSDIDRQDVADPNVDMPEHSGLKNGR
jgi:hypothetical protein